jgi:hypothetical protein
MRALALAIASTAILFAGCGGGNAEAEMVWCVGPGETVDAEFKREYPELRMPKAECEAVDRAFEKTFSD